MTGANDDLIGLSQAFWHSVGIVLALVGLVLLLVTYVDMLRRSVTRHRAPPGNRIQAVGSHASAAPSNDPGLRDWQCHVREVTIGDPEGGSRMALSFELQSMGGPDGQSLNGAEASCEVRQHANVYKSRKPSAYGDGGTLDGFTFVFPDDFAAPDGLPQPTLSFTKGVRSGFLVIWHSDVLSEQMQHSFRLSSAGRLEA